MKIADVGRGNLGSALAASIGFATKDSSPLDQSRTLEWFSWLRISTALKDGDGRDTAFSFLRR